MARYACQLLAPVEVFVKDLFAPWALYAFKDYFLTIFVVQSIISIFSLKTLQDRKWLPQTHFIAP